MSENAAPTHDDRRLGALTGIRFFAAAAVLVCHFAQLGVAPLPKAVVTFLDGGRPAVTLFFVLSGFVLAFNYSNMRRNDRRGFYVARIARIYPNVLLGLAIAVPTVVIALLDHRQDYMLQWFALDGNYALALGASLIAQLTMATAWLPIASLNQPWNGPAWSIGCEMFFYALFPFILVVLSRLRLRVAAWLVFSVFLVQGLLILGIYSFAPVGRAGFLISQFPVTHLFSFVLGIFLAQVFYRYRSKLEASWLRVGMLLAGWAGVIIIALWQPLQPVYYLSAPFFGLVVLGLAASGRARSWLSWRPLLLLGEASFALYMIHLPLGHLLQWAGVREWLGWAAVVAVIGLSIVVLRFWETPARRWIRRRFAPRPAPQRQDSAPSAPA